MTAKNLMTFRVVTVLPSDKVSHALMLMHKNHVRNLPVVDESGEFVGLFGIRRLSRMLLPKAASNLGRYSLTDISFMPENLDEIINDLRKFANKPVSDFLEKEKKLQFCTPDTPVPEVLKLLDDSKDTSLPVIIVTGKEKKLVGLVSAWDVFEWIVFLASMQQSEGMEVGNKVDVRSGQNGTET
jgi:CBS domain-containing protein